jgi:DNA (cytosine-5)-methyltransferase 1
MRALLPLPEVSMSALAICH